MKIFGRRGLWLMLTILMLGSVSLSQTSTTSITQIHSKAVLIQFCEKAKDEVVLLRARIKDDAVSLQSYEDALGKAEQAGNLSDEQITFYQNEVGSLRTALASDRDALGLKEKESLEYQKALAKMTKSRNFFKSLFRVTAVTTVTLVAVAALVILRK